MAPFDLRNHKTYIIPLDKSDFQIFDLPDKTENYITGCRISNEPTPGNHPEKVKQAIEYIRRDKDLKKLVVSSRFDFTFDTINGEGFFYAAARTYPGSFVYYWHHPKAGFAMAGASPEVLLAFYKNKKDGVFSGQTFSLAGTKFKDDRTEWTEKEKVEQQIVTDFIKKQLFDLKLAVSTTGPFDSGHGHLIHLRTDINFLFDDEITPVDDILKALHPTPAVGGCPRRKPCNSSPKSKNTTVNITRDFSVSGKRTGDCST
jgi:isochorismate synthase